MCSLDYNYIYNIRAYNESDTQPVGPKCHLKHKEIREKKGKKMSRVFHHHVAKKTN